MKIDNKYDIFISYSRKDFEQVNIFVEMLKQRIPTLTCWFDLTAILYVYNKIKDKITDDINAQVNATLNDWFGVEYKPA